MWTGDAFLERLYVEAGLTRAAAAAGLPPDLRRERLLESVKESLGAWERQSEIGCSVMEEESECDGYSRSRVELSVVPDLSFGAYILKPAGAAGKLPGVIAVHGHGYGSRQICGMQANGAKTVGKPDIHNQFAVQLVRRGMIVIAPDVIGFGERRMQADVDRDADAPSSCYRMATQLLMLGRTLTGLRVAEMLGALEAFAGMREVDPERIGIVGFSGGALIAFLTAALDTRLRASVLIGFPNTFKDSIMAVHHCVCNFTPGVLTQAELPELMGLIAPRPLFLESGERDPIFPAAGFLRAADDLRSIYRSRQAEEALSFDLFPGGHEVSGRRSFDWLKDRLS
ncbi:Dienelactone hydrolase [Paenibacillus sp. UNCCL117]|uniref:dienelactone hydrolase family protein n=1 Tax=unclassified Paenibacillus TaxID=185978 RepID=UPI00088ED934|nr:MULTISPECIES: alpha/beta hydrolase family protein [unclassified Paenibacillus]SDD06617.1 Dienelactone hydrolase [Paenibacillus sp. cl123]SFW31651.1 Dienelactone hydrolase [Paenibacillus sp. UNCCL117]